MSKKREALNAQRRAMLEDNFGPRDTWRCWLVNRPALMVMMGGCYGAVAGHELVKRSQGGSITDPRNIILLCSRHNAWVEDFPDDAHKIGLMKHNWEDQ